MAEEGDWGQYAADVDDENVTEAPTADDLAAANELVVPGDCIADALTFSAGSGTYKCLDKIHAAIVGVVFRENNVVSVRATARTEETKPANPSAGSSVIARVIRVNPRHVTCDILSIEGVPLKVTCRGQIRATDVTENVNLLSVYDHYRPGDIIKACIVTASLAKSVLLTTQSKQFGVLAAECKNSPGRYMVPVASNLMRCPDTKVYEFRKVKYQDE